MKKMFLALVLCTLLLAGCGEKPYKETVITEKNYFTIFRGEHGLTDEEKEFINYGTTQYAFTPEGMYNKTINDILEEGKAIKEEKDAEANKPENKLSDILNEFVTPLWNDGFCEVDSYIKSGTGSTGGEFDYEYSLRKVTKLMEKRDECNNYVTSLPDDKYSEVKYLWGKMIPELDDLYAKMKEKAPKANDTSSSFNIDKFYRYMNDLSDEIYNLQEN